MVYYVLGQYEKAMEYYRKALAMHEELGMRDSMASCLMHVGMTYYATDRYREAIPYLEKSVALIESHRLTAEGALRRDFLATQMNKYRFLSSAYLRNGSAQQSFDTAELASAKYLSEQLRGKSDIVPAPFSIGLHLSKISPNSIVVNVSNVEWTNTLVLLADRKGVAGKDVNKMNFINKVWAYCKVPITDFSEKSRGISITPNTKERENDSYRKHKSAFDRIIDYYRYLLTRVRPTEQESAARDFVARELYSMLFSGIDKYLNGKSEVIIIPGGIMAFIPFETLIMPDGRYMAEKYNIRYIQSLTVSEIIEKRSYGSDRKTMLAFGGAVYDAGQYKTDMITSEGQLKSVISAIGRGEDARRAYAGLGYTWANLPGTLAEVNAIKSLVRKAVIYTGDEVTKARFLEMSKNGELKKYKVIHLATHGLVTPEAPELSAVVFSQLKNPAQGDDGYLRADEILKLNMRADFVNLSACETGLGKLYSGEGVVGLTQAFLIAGANGLSVSLWSVADESTTEFMSGMYKLAMENNMTYYEAMAEMKRRFIKSSKWSSPYYWAPFVYYGK
jgi:CHAT domain-containing protein